MSKIVARSPAVEAVAFVDWNSQLLLTGRNLQFDPEAAAKSAFEQTTRRIASCLSSVAPELRFRVVLRLYHGWHKGYEPTANRKAAKVVVGRADFSTLSPKPNVIFSPNVGFGDRLTASLDRRLHARLAVHLPNTVRKRYGDELEEKMVDTALVADVVSTAYREPQDWIVVVTEDDDLIPSIYVAEAVLAASTGRAVLLRKRNHMGMLSLDDLLIAD